MRVTPLRQEHSRRLGLNQGSPLPSSSCPSPVGGVEARHPEVAGACPVTCPTPPHARKEASGLGRAPHLVLCDDCFLFLCGCWTPALLALAPGFLLFPGGSLWPAFSSIFLLLFLFLPGFGPALEVSASLPTVDKVKPGIKLLGQYGIFQSPDSLTAVPAMPADQGAPMLCALHPGCQDDPKEGWTQELIPRKSSQMTG